MTYLNERGLAASVAAQEKFLCGNEKTAVLLAAGMSALGGHLGTNIAGRSAHHASNLAEVMAHRGFQHGLLGQRINPGRQLSMKALMGPESLATYELARQAGLQAVEHAPNPIERAKYLQGIHGVASTQSNLDHVPIIDPIRQAVMHELAGTAPELQATNRATKGYGKIVNWLADQTETGFETGAQKLVGNMRGIAPAAALAALEPAPMAGHFAVNMTREGLSKTPQGQRFMKNELAKGLRGQMPGPVKSMAVDLLGSPALLDGRRAAYGVRNGMSSEHAEMAAQQLDKYKTLGEAANHVKSLAQEHGVNKENISGAISQAKEVGSSLPKMQTKEPPVNLGEPVASGSANKGVYRTAGEPVAQTQVAPTPAPAPSISSAPPVPVAQIPKAPVTSRPASRPPTPSAPTPKPGMNRLLAAAGGGGLVAAGGARYDQENRPRNAMLGAAAGAGAAAAGAHFLGR